jgi:hypothetical protein
MFSSPKSQHEVRIIGTGVGNRGLKTMWGSAVSPGVGAPMMIHNCGYLVTFYTTLFRWLLSRFFFLNKAKRTSHIAERQKNRYVCTSVSPYA